MAIDTLSLDFGRDKPFYTYVYRDPRPRKNNQPIYVGKGASASNRADVHWMHGARNPFLKNVLGVIRKAGLKPVIEIVAWFDIEADAHALEIALIARFGRRDLGRGPLLNLTDGGDGVSGLIVGPEVCEKHRVNGIQNWLDASDEERARMLSGVAWGDPERDEIRCAGMRKARALEQADVARWAAHIAACVVTKKANAGRTSEQIKEYYATATPEKLESHRSALKIARQADAIETGKRTKAMWAEPGKKEQQGKAISVGQTSAWSDPVRHAARVAKRNATIATRKAEKKAEAEAIAAKTKMGGESET